MSDVRLRGVERNIEIDQKTTVELFFQLFDESSAVLDMTGYDIRFRVVDDKFKTIIDGTIANGNIEWVSQSIGKFKIYLTPEDTASVKFIQDDKTSLSCQYDIEVIAPVSPPGTQRPFYGAFTIIRAVTP